MDGAGTRLECSAWSAPMDSCSACVRKLPEDRGGALERLRESYAGHPQIVLLLI